MPATWLIESNVYGDEISPLLAEIRRQGMTAAVVPYRSLAKGSSPTIDGRPLPPDACVIAYGTFPFARQVQLHHPWLPGAWCDAVNLDCSTYFAHFGRYLLNEHYAIMPGVEAIRQRDWLFEVFARPTSCPIQQKSPAGQRLARLSCVCLVRANFQSWRTTLNPGANSAATRRRRCP